MHYDRDALRATTELLRWSPETCYELRALGVRDFSKAPEHQFRSAVSGYFDDAEQMIRAAAELSGRAEGVYFIPQPLRPEVLCRAKNRLEWRPKHTTTDDEVLCRRYLLVDCDPVRPEGISSTDAEHEVALHRAGSICYHLRAKGIRGIVLSSSGNGAHLLVPLADLSNDEPTRRRCEAILKDLAARFDDPVVKIDQKVFNAARLVRFYGTKAMKGDHCPENGRPHRISRILEVDPR
jgi:hypothetical protein